MSILDLATCDKEPILLYFEMTKVAIRDYQFVLACWHNLHNILSGAICVSALAPAALWTNSLL